MLLNQEFHSQIWKKQEDPHVLRSAEKLTVSTTTTNDNFDD